MLVVVVETEAFTGTFLHTSEVPESVWAKIRDDSYGVYSECIDLLEMTLLDQSLKEKFLDLKLTDALKVWNQYRLAIPEDREVPDGLPEGL